MQTVFVSGSIRLKTLHPKVLERLQTIVDNDLEVIVGDANGADKAFQSELVGMDAKNVTVYCSGETPRNNMGNWPVEKIASAAKSGTREFYTEKDLSMSRKADFGMMLWDSKSTGTLRNVMEMCKQKKPSLVFINRKHAFLSVKDEDSFNSLLSVMSDQDWLSANKKLQIVETERQLSMQM